MQREMTHPMQLMKGLPPLVSVVVWDVINDRIDELTVKVAQATSKEELERYDLIRCVVAADTKHPPQLTRSVERPSLFVQIERLRGIYRLSHKKVNLLNELVEQKSIIKFSKLCGTL
jgi:hypothetical protein